MVKALICLAMLFCSLSAEEMGGVPYSLQGKWQVAENFQTEDQQLISYLPEGETSTQWTELFTAQMVKQFNKVPSEFFQLFVEQLKLLAPGKNLQTKVLKSGEKDFFAEWWIADNSSQDQHEWIRLVDKQGDLIILRYTTKKMDQLDTSRKKAEDMLFSTRGFQEQSASKTLLKE